MDVRSNGHRSVCRCEQCSKARRLITAAITARMDNVIACLEQSDIGGAELQAAALQITVEQMPPTVSELLAREALLKIKETAKRGLTEVKQDAPLKALTTYQSGLKMWLEQYAAARVHRGELSELLH